ncbi:hypothetical protein EQG41_20825 [Billgrantia azerbaijanica]|nr:hypothetical protein EQG41_20825 [Halomonas azerbaijanica]
MAFEDVLANTTITGFSDPDEATIVAAMRTAYDGSTTAKAMFDNWIGAGNTIEIDFLVGAFQASANAGELEIDLAFLTNASYIANDGTVVQDTAVTAIT